MGTPGSKPIIATKCMHQIAEPAATTVYTFQPRRWTPAVRAARRNRRMATQDPAQPIRTASNTSQGVWLSTIHPNTVII